MTVRRALCATSQRWSSASRCASLVNRSYSVMGWLSTMSCLVSTIPGITVLASTGGHPPRLMSISLSGCGCHARLLLCLLLLTLCCWGPVSMFPFSTHSCIGRSRSTLPHTVLPRVSSPRFAQCVRRCDVLETTVAVEVAFVGCSMVDLVRPTVIWGISAACSIGSRKMLEVGPGCVGSLGVVLFPGPALGKYRGGWCMRG